MFLYFSDNAFPLMFSLPPTSYEYLQVHPTAAYKIPLSYLTSIITEYNLHTELLFTRSITMNSVDNILKDIRVIDVLILKIKIETNKSSFA